MDFMNKTEFVELYYPSVKEVFLKKRYENIYTNLCSFVEDIDAITEISFEEFKKIFESFQFKSLPDFHTHKKMLSSILEVHGFNFRSALNLRKIKYDDIYYEEDVLKTYFKSESELYDSISFALSMDSAIKDYNRYSIFVVSGLLWFGFSLVDIQNTHIENIDFENNRIYNLKTQESVGVSDKLMEHIKRYLRNRPLDSSYLFCNRDGDITQQSTIGKRLSWLNAYEEQTGKMFSANNIAFSGLFERIYNGTEEHETLSKDKRIKYDAWVACYKSEE